MAALGVRSIQQFNERCEKELAPATRRSGSSRAPIRSRASRSRISRSPYIVVVIDELADLMVVCANGRRGVAAAARADGARGRHPPRTRDAAAERRRAHGRDQGELPGAHLVPGVVEDRLAHDARSERRRASCSARATCSSCRRAHRSCSACTVPSSPSVRVGSLTELPARAGAPCFEEDLVGSTRRAKSATSGGEDVDEMYDRGGRDRRADPQRVDLLCAAPAQDRLQPRCADRRAHGERRAVVGPQIGTRPRAGVRERARALTSNRRARAVGVRRDH